MSRWTNVGTPLPYCGPLDDRVERLGSPHILKACGPDTSGTRAYCYNSLGYRGGEFRPDARLRIYAFGESDAFGLGLDFADAWPSRVVAELRRRVGLAEHEVCFMNFAEPGASCDLIARQVITQCSAARPDLVLINYAEPGRTEGVVQGRVFSVGAWFADTALREHIASLSESQVAGHPFAEALFRGDSYLDFTNEQHSWLASVRAVLLSQYFLKGTETLALATVRPQWDLVDSALLEHLAIGPLMDRVDAGFLRAHPHARPTIDRSADGGHLGPRTHAEIGEFVVGELSSAGTVEALRRLVHDRTESQSPRRD